MALFNAVCIAFLFCGAGWLVVIRVLGVAEFWEVFWWEGLGLSYLFLPQNQT
jgi:hypothetical protein